MVILSVATLYLYNKGTYDSSISSSWLDGTYPSYSNGASSITLILFTSGSHIGAVSVISTKVDLTNFFNVNF